MVLLLDPLVECNVLLVQAHIHQRVVPLARHMTHHVFAILNTTESTIKLFNARRVTCPPGLICNGFSSVQPVVNGSQWTAIRVGINDFYRLIYCPEGYEYAQISVNVTVSNAPTVIPNQACSPCIAGMECTSPPCSSCTECKPGHYKSCTGPNNCGLCPENFFEPQNRSTQC